MDSANLYHLYKLVFIWVSFGRFPLTAYHFSELSYHLTEFFSSNPTNSIHPPLFCFGLFCESANTVVVYLRYVFAYLLMFCKFFAYLLTFCKFSLCIVILALKHAFMEKEQLRRDFVEIWWKRDGFAGFIIWVSYHMSELFFSRLRRGFIIWLSYHMTELRL